MAPREPPIILEPVKQPSSSDRLGALIFLHGLSDEAAGVSDIGSQIQASSGLTYFKFVFPNALENRDMMTTAWYIQSRLTHKPASRPELEEDEDDSGLLQSVTYVESLIQDLVTKDSIPLERIVLGGFSQGMAVSLLLSLISKKYAGKLGGILAVCGYLPLERQLSSIQKEHEIEHETLPGITRIFIMRGKADALVPRRYLDIAKNRLEEHGYGTSTNEGDRPNLTIKEYENVGHTITGEMIRDMALWMQAIVPEVSG